MKKVSNEKGRRNPSELHSLNILQNSKFSKEYICTKIPNCDRICTITGQIQIKVLTTFQSYLGKPHRKDVYRRTTEILQCAHILRLKAV